MKLKKRCMQLLAAVLLLISLPVKAFALTPDLGIVSDTYVVMDAKTGQILLEKNKDKQKAPASITKILTLALALEKGNLDDVITVSKDAVYSIEPGSTHIALVPGEVITFRDAVMGTQLISANDAANVVAEYAGGSMDAFVAMMNNKVAELGLKNSHFANPNGLDAKGHYITAADMATITRYALSVPGFAEIFGATEYQMPPTNIKARNWTFYAQNAIMFPSNREYYDGILGGKLGYTHNANHTLVALAKRGDMELIVVALDTKMKNDKFTDAKKLFDYAFEHFERMTISSKELRAKEIPVSSKDSPTHYVKIKSEQDHVFAVPLGTPKSSLRIEYNLPEYYANTRRIEPSFTVYGPDNNILYTAPLQYDLLDLEKIALAPPTVRLPKAAYINDFMLLALKCLIVLLIVGITCYLIMRSMVITNYAVKKRTSRKKYEESLRRKEQAYLRNQEELERMENEHAALLGDRYTHTVASTFSTVVPDNVTHIYPKRNVE